MSFFFLARFSLEFLKKKNSSLSLSSHHQVRPARLEQLEDLVQWRDVQDVLHPVGTDPARVAAGAPLQRDDRPDLDLIVGVDQNQILRVKDADDVLPVALPDGDAGVSFFFGKKKK